jgi:nucleoside-diphosphate-sugar epimerase
MSGPIAFTGATGFIGTSLLKELRRLDWKIRALTRKPRKDDENMEWITGDLHNRDALTQLVHGAEVVIHCAGVVRGRSWKDFFQTNVEGTENLIGLLAQLDPPPKFLFISSLAAREPRLSWYASSKRLAEEKIVQYSGIMPWTIFRPTAVYGPGDRELKPLFRIIRRGILPVIGKPSKKISLLYIDDLVSAILHWVSAPKPVRGTYEIADGTSGGYDFYMVARIAKETWQIPVRIIPLPVVLCYLLAGMNILLANIFRYSPIFTPGKIRELSHPDWNCDIAAIEQVLPGWHPLIRLQEGLNRSV